MPIILGNVNQNGGGIEKIYLGNTPIKAAYLGAKKIWPNIRTEVTVQEAPIKAGWDNVGTYDDWYWNFKKVTERQDGLKKIITTKTYKGDELLSENTAEEIIRNPVNGTYQQGEKTKAHYSEFKHHSYSYPDELASVTFIHPITGEKKVVSKWFKDGEDKYNYPVTKTGWGTATYTYPPEWDN